MLQPFRRSSIRFLFVLFFHEVLNRAGGTGPLWIPVPTKLFHNGGSTTWSVVCTCNPKFWNCWQAVTLRCFAFLSLQLWRIFHHMSDRLSTSSRHMPVQLSTSSRRMSVQFSVGFRCNYGVFSTDFEPVSSWWSIWTPLWRTTTTWSTSSPRWWSLLGQC